MAAVAPTSTWYSNGSAFTVQMREDAAGKKFFDTGAAKKAFAANEQSFDLAVVQFDDDGRFADHTTKQIDAAAARIRDVRRSPGVPCGALVVVFVHGWHHGAAWDRTPSIPDDEPDGDTHFHGFRLMLQSLAFREAERYSPADGSPTGRRIIGVYLSWNGDPQSGLHTVLSHLPLGSEASFWNRYTVAERIGAAADFQSTLQQIVTVAKHEAGPESPLVLIGHSMGALMMQSAFATLLEQGALVQPANGVAPGPTLVTSHGAHVLFPDLVLSLNSAADSKLAQGILAAYQQLGLEKIAEGQIVRYNAPLLASVTSNVDTATGVWWPRARLWQATTDGHDPSLTTHDLTLLTPPLRPPCLAMKGPDFGQNWHCIHMPDPPLAASPLIPISLPQRERNGRADLNVPHDQYALTPRKGSSTPCLQWIFQVSDKVISDHNDIFNSRARSLTLALIQMSGAVTSLAHDWDDTFVL